MYRFGPFQVDPRAHELRRSGIRIKVQEQPFVVLLKLLERPGELVTREELRSAIWPADTFVDFETGLNTVIKRLREVLRDSAEVPLFIETVPRLGYRFITQVECFDGERAGTAVSAKKRRISAIAKWTIAAAVSLVAAAIATYLLTRPLPRPSVADYVQITNDGTSKVPFLGYSSLVTDGLRLYFTHEFNGAAFNLAQVSAGGGETVPVPTPFPAFLGDISPNHSQLLLFSLSGEETEHRMWALPALGGSLQRIGDLLGHDGTWSPDGQEIVYARGQDLLATPVHGSESRKLVTAPGRASWLRYSPDASRLRFTVNDPKTNSQSLWEVSADWSNFHPLLSGWNDPPAECCGNWTRDGKYFVFQATRAGRTGIYVIAERGRAFRKAGEEPLQLTAGPLNYYSPVPSLDGERIYVVGSQPRGELQRYGLKTHRLEVFLPGLSAEGLDFSKDGKWLAYVTFPEGNLWRSKADGSERMQLTFPPLSVFLPRWSPDAKRIAFSGTVPGKPHGVYVLSAEGGRPEELTRGEHDEGDVCWSPDGNQLVFGSMGGNDFATFGIRLFDLKTHEMSLVPNSQGLYSPRWSPNGKYLAALTMIDDMVLFDFRTQKWVDLALGNSKLIAGFPNWSSNSEYVFFDGGIDRSRAFYRVRISDHKLERLFDMINLRKTGTYGWSGLGADDSPLLLHDTGREEIYALNVVFP